MNALLQNDDAPVQGREVSTANNNQQFAFYLPRVETVRGRILGALLRGDRLTQQDSLRRFSDFRLAAQIEALRKSGWAIVTEMIDVGTRDAGRKAEIAKYHLPAEVIAAAAGNGLEYASAALEAEHRRRVA